LELSHYNSYYELFGGLSAALVGIEYITKYFSTQIKQKFNSLKSKTRKIISACRDDIYFTEIAFNTLNLEQEEKDKALDNIAKRKQQVKLCEDILNSFILDKEIGYISAKSTRISIFVFLYCISLLLISGLEQDGLITAPLALCGTLTLFAFHTITVIAYCVCREKGMKLRYAVYAFLLTLIAAVIHYSLGNYIAVKPNRLKIEDKIGLL
jgi:hypothetical protein